MEYRKLDTLQKLEGNPRVIRDKQFKTLCTSLKANPDYFEARPLILSDRTGELVIIAGNQRYEAAKSIGLESVPTYLIPDLTEEREREIVIRDNVNNGEWDMDELANSWADVPLEEWGVNVVTPYEGGDVDLDSFFEQSDAAPKEQGFKIVLEYTEAEHAIVLEAFKRHTGSKESIVYELLGC